MKTDDHFPPAKAVAGVGIALCLYVGLYIFLSNPMPLRNIGTVGLTIHWNSPGAPGGSFYHPTTYRTGGWVSEFVFLPLRRLAVGLFPGRWSPGILRRFYSPAASPTP